MSVPERIRQIFSRTLKARHVEVIDDSAGHAGHAGNRAGGGHYSVLVVSDVFQGQSLVERHRSVYAALPKEVHEQIHALAIKAVTPEEWKKRLG